MAIPTFPGHAVTPTMHPLAPSLTKIQQEEREEQVRGNRSGSAPASGLSRLFGFFEQQPSLYSLSFGANVSGSGKTMEVSPALSHSSAQLGTMPICGFCVWVL